MQNPLDYRFSIGLLAGTVLGVGLALWLVPRAAAEARGRLMDSAAALRDRADDTVGELVGRVNTVRDEVADSVVNVAKKVEHIAKAAKA